jgi:ribosomal-protein-alanine N-acetyltransferase
MLRGSDLGPRGGSVVISSEHEGGPVEDRGGPSAGGAVSLRPLKWADLDGVHALISRAEVVRQMLLPIGTRADSEQFVRDAIAEFSDRPWRSVVRAICAGGGLVGLAGLSALRGAEDAEIWYLVAPDWWGRGIASAAVRQVLSMGFGELALHRIWATCLPENPASARVLEKVGMRREGFLVSNVKIHGEWKSSYLYAILTDELAAV